MIVVGVNAYHGDASAVLVRDGVLVAAVEEERIRRIKHWAGFPSESLRACLEIAGVEPGDVDHFAISRNPRAHVWRKAVFALSRRPGLGAATSRLKNAASIYGVGSLIAETLGMDHDAVERRMRWVEHHPAHLASAFFVSPFESAAVCAIDGFGDFVSTSWGVGRGDTLEVVRRVYFPQSLGLLYLALTQYLGFPKFGDEYKVMGLAACADPDYARSMRKLVRLGPDGSFALDLSFFRHASEGVSMTWESGEPVIEPAYTPKLEALLGPARRPDTPIEPRHEAIASSLQSIFEEAAFHVLDALQRRTGLTDLCLAGGCAMNSVANGKIRERTAFRRVFVQPAAADNGTALGAAFHVWNQVLRRPRRFVMEHASWGPAFGDASIEAALTTRREELARQRCTTRDMHDDEDLCRFVAERIAEGKIVGWCQGRMEWGPRALGHRSILADPRRPEMRDILNTRIKLRETFRPFAPSVLEEALDEYFVGAARDPFMTSVYPIRADRRAVIPAVVHVDGSGRLQSVSRQTNPLYWQLISAFEKVTGVPLVLNTSFNENEPIVLGPEDALDCFLRTRMDVLVLGHTVVARGSGP